MTIMGDYIQANVQEMMNKEEAARYLGVPVRRLEYWRYSKKGPAYCLGPSGKVGGVIYLKSDLDAYKSLIRRVVPKLMQNALAEVERVA